MSTQDEAAHPISLEQTFFTRNIVIAMPDYVPTESGAPPSIVNNIDVKELENRPGMWFASMRTVVNDIESNEYPYKIDMECHATLRADESLSPAEAKRGITITAHSVLYGAIREQVAWLTARQPYGGFMLGLSILRNKPVPEK